MVAVTASLEGWNRLLGKAQQQMIVDAFRAFRKHDIEPILIKGWAAARKYPPDQVRRPGDVDLCVSPADYELACRLHRGAELQKCDIDLHDGFRALDTVPWEDLYGRSQLVDIGGEWIRVLADEDHLRVLCTHWLVDGGGYKDKLWDIYYAVQNRSPEFDWDKCLNDGGPIRRGWVVCGILLAHHFLGLDVADLPIKDDPKSLPKWVVRTVEREWKRPYRLEPILTSRHDKRLLFDQIARRLPPNPIRCTIESEGDIFGNRRVLYQLSTMKRRIFPLFKDLVSLAKMRRGRDNQ